jgi:hypothetical protein
VGEKDQRRRQAAFVLMKMVLGNPRAVEAQAFRVANLFGGQPVALFGVAWSSRRVKKPRRLRVMQPPCSGMKSGEWRR